MLFRQKGELSLKSYTLNLLRINTEEKNKQLLHLYRQMSQLLTHCTAESFINRLATKNDVQQKIRIYIRGTEVVGFTSWRVEEIMIGKSAYAVHRSVNAVKAGKRNVSSEKFLLSEIFKYNIKNILKKQKSIFLCSATGPATYYCLEKYFSKIYPSADEQHEPYLEQIARDMVRYFNFDTKGCTPIKIRSAFKVNDCPVVKESWSKSSQKSVQYFIKHTPHYYNPHDEPYSLLVVSQVGIKELLNAMKKLMYSRGIKWLIGKL
ncbi:hypothetical protein SG34_032600 [Thalassomonas viridans]|uniref:Uncharacterized protein n=1 Tax=Thalassomonas viridans TaxID=137584 RepID=A0AAE9Z9V8_9GAMM|nr:hypothetical protein [Thalassomonas viridans]WDE08659.1 hypothetical protein SG34_032600 [Thalassomonas viridans]